jgi:hypothetical protein
MARTAAQRLEAWLEDAYGSVRRAGRRAGFSAARRLAIRSGEESVFCSTALLRRGFISADF